ncbi:MAG: 3-dehydroquinate synthase [Geobacteraceae bacterium]|nr:3-dehydroquinate synthase [Geobacteraceae bacterium]
MAGDLAVKLGVRSYDIKFGRGIATEVGRFCRDLDLGNHVAVVSNPNIWKYCGDTVVTSLLAAGFAVHKVEIPDGESFKNSETLNRIYDFLIEEGLDRQSFLVALGGGVIGDITGFAASTYLRGIPFIQIPTTLLAQVDSSVGGKTGINHKLGKNLIGAFYQPRLVVIDSAMLDTLPEREYLSGLAEVVKYGVVCDGRFFDFLESSVEKLLSRESDCVLKTVRKCCELKASVVERDEREGSYRAVLNFGHTFAHAIEKLTEYSHFLHGEAVAIGIVHAARLSESMGYASAEDTMRIVDLLKSLHLPTEFTGFASDEYFSVMLRDKKVRDGGINFVFNKGLGNSVIERVTDWDCLLKNVVP